MNIEKIAALIAVGALVLVCLYALYLSFKGTRQVMRMRRINAMARSMREDFEAQQPTPDSRQVEFDEAGLRIYDAAGILRVRMGHLGTPYIYPYPDEPEHAVALSAAPPVVGEKSSGNCINCGAPAIAPTCSYCGTQH